MAARIGTCSCGFSPNHRRAPTTARCCRSPGPPSNSALTRSSAPTITWPWAGLARETSRIRLGTLMSPVTFRRPGPLAIIVAQVDQMSGGRVELGLGTGWFEAEHTAYAIPFPGLGDRFGLLEEQL